MPPRLERALEQVQGSHAHAARDRKARPACARASPHAHRFASVTGLARLPDDLLEQPVRLADGLLERLDGALVDATRLAGLATRVALLVCHDEDATRAPVAMSIRFVWTVYASTYVDTY